MVELIVVIGIIALLATLTLPAVSRMWEDSRRSDTDNKLRGLLMSARGRALNSEDHGLFFFVQGGTQKVVSIERDDGGQAAGPNTENRFRVDEDAKVYEFANPFRVMPREVLRQVGDPPQYVWTDEELANNDYRNLTTDTTGPTAGAHNHRNFFTVLFSDDGRLLMTDPILINDAPRVNASGIAVVPGPGTVTGLTVDDVDDYQNETGAAPVALTGTLSGMIVSNGQPGSAINFPSVDGFLLYDESAFEGFPDAAFAGQPGKREYLIGDAQPVYISRQTGAIVRGPRGESEPPE